MAKSVQYAHVGKRKLKLSNLSKILYPGIGLLKAEVIQYYLSIAPVMLRHIKRRPLSSLRFPDGIEGKSFFQKELPDWAPDWIESVTLGSTAQKNYMLPTDEASLVWLANLASLELHHAQVRHPEFENPDYFVFDLDPPDDKFSFADTKEIAINLKAFVESFGYHPFVKTSGCKGVHVLLPIVPDWSIDVVYEASKLLATEFVKAYPKITTLNIKKNARGGKLLMDIYRNRNAQTIVGAYSLRASPGAPVSMPLTWEDFAETQSSLDWNIRNVLDKVSAEGDAWEGFSSHATKLHTNRNVVVKKRKNK